MLTMNYIINSKMPLDYRLTSIDKQHLINENMNANYVYFCLLKEMLSYPTSVRDLLRGWCGINLFKIE